MDLDGGAPGGGEPPTPGSSGLLPREREVLALASKGLGPAGIALRLHLPRRAVEELLRRCVWRLGAADLRAAIEVAQRRRLLD